MWKRIAFVSKLLMILFVSLLISAEIASTAARTVTVPDDYPTIQEAVDAASDGDIILVRSGSYCENVFVNKTVSLVGENKDTTTIDGNGSVALTIVADHVAVSDFTVQNGGIALRGSYYCTIVHNNVINNVWGIDLGNACYCNIAYNTVADNGCGIFLDQSRNNSIRGNTVARNGYGVFLDFGSSNNSISGNDIGASNLTGISLWEGADHNYVGHNNVTHSDHGIWLHNAWNNSISRNNIGNNGVGINARYSDYNRVCENNITSNSQYGLLLEYSDWWAIYHNSFVNNTYQAEPRAHDTEWDNGYPSGGNYWSDYSGTDLYSGPYQNETGGDGIGDTPHAIDPDDVDHYPLISIYTPILGDVDANDIVNMLDLYSIAIRFGARFGDLDYDIACDVNNDNMINMIDLYIAAVGFGQKCP